ncbi:MAG: DUF3630 family protein [Planctomycetota bacterium]
MASGEEALTLSNTVDWEGFPSFAKEFTEACGLDIKSKGDSPEMRIWAVKRNGVMLNLVFEDYPQQVSLEPKDAGSEIEIRRIYEMLIG